MIQDFTNKPQPFEILRGSANVFNILETKMGEGYTPFIGIVPVCGVGTSNETITVNHPQSDGSPLAAICYICPSSRTNRSGFHGKKR